jgi:hypothetical protein
LVSIAVLVVVLALQHAHSSPVLAAPPAQQVEIVPLKPQPPAGQKPGTELEPIKSGTLTGLPAAEWYIYGLQSAVKDLQGQVKALQDQTKTLQSQAAADQSTIKTLQSSLQSFQTQFANHTHTYTSWFPGHQCGSMNTYWVGDGNTHQPVLVPITVPTKCLPNTQGDIPSSYNTVKTSVPVQGTTGSQQ